MSREGGSSQRVSSGGGKGRKKGRVNDDGWTAISAETTTVDDGVALCYVIHQHSAVEAAAASEDK